MRILKKHTDLILLLCSNLKENEFCFGGSISDYFILKKIGINVNILINDIDICVYNKQTINKLNEILKVEMKHVNDVDNSIFKYKQYYIRYNDCSLDVFLRDDNLKLTQTTFNGFRLFYTSIEERYDILKKAILNEYILRPDDNNRQLKYIKKLMLYKFLKSNENK